MLFNIYRYITLASSTTYILYISFIYIYILYIYIDIYIYRSITPLDLLQEKDGQWQMNPDAPVPISAVLQ